MKTRNSQIQFEQVLHTGFQNQTLIQDRDGFLWIGCSGGLIRYDGYDLKFYKKGPGSLSATYVPAILQDSDGVLWLGTSGGLTQFDKETGAFTHSQPPLTASDDVCWEYVYALLEDRAGALWVGSDRGLHQFDRRTGQFTSYRHNPQEPAGLGKGAVSALWEDESGVLWVGTSMGGLGRFDRATGTFVHHVHQPERPGSLSDNFVTAILRDRAGTLWIGTGGGGLNVFDPSTQMFRHYASVPDDPASLSGSYVTDLYEDKTGQLWIGCFEGGLCQFHRETQTFTRYQHDPRDPTSLPQGAVGKICQDRSGIVWILMMAGQMVKYNPHGQRFKLYQYRPDDPHSLSANVILPIYEDRQGVVWIGTGDGGLNRFNRETETFSRYDHDPNDPASLPSSFVSALFEEDEGTFWVATSDNVQATLSVLDRTTGKCLRRYTHDPHDPASLVEGRVIRSIIQDRDDADILWIALQKGGLEKFNRRLGTFAHHLPDPADPHSLRHNEAYQVYQDQEGVLWIALMGSNRGGVDRLDKRTGIFTHYVHRPEDETSISSNYVTAILEACGALWFATDNGLNRLDRAGETFTRYTTREGLPDNFVYGLLADETGQLWLGTNDGLARFDPRTGTVKVYRQSDGLQADAFFYSAYAQTREGEMWFGGLNGVNRFYPRDIIDNPHVPPIALTSLKQDGIEMPPRQDICRLREITLDGQRNFFEFEFAALEFTQPEKNQYAYMLEGFDADWYYAGSKRFGRYSNLPGGQYTLRLKGCNNDGVWNEQGVALRVTVLPPPWQAALRESEERFRSLVETSSDWIWEVNRHTAFTYSSPRVRDILGYAPEEVMGKTPLDLVLPSEAPSVAAAFEAAARSRQPIVQVEHTSLHKDGRRLVIETTGVPITDENGHLLGFRGVDRDITERKQAEAALRESEERYRVISEMISDYAYSYQIDLDGRLGEGWVTEDSYRRLTGYTWEETARTFAVYHPDDAERARQQVQDTLQGKPTQGEYRIITRSGELRWIHLRRWTRRDAQENRVVRLYGVAQDITERKQAEQSLRESERTARALLDATTDAVFLADLSGQVLAVNEQFCRRYQRSAHELVGTFMDESSPPHVAQARRDYFNQVIQTRQVVRFEDERGGIWLENTFYPIADDTGPVVKIALYSRDITERKQAEESLRRYAEQLETLRQISQDLGALRDLDTLLYQIVERAVRFVHADRGGIYLHRPERQVLELAVRFRASAQRSGITLERGEGLAGKVWATGEPLIVDDYINWSGQSLQWAGYEVHAIIGVPIKWGDEFLGVLNAQFDTPAGRFTSGDAELLSHFTTYAAIAIQNTRLWEQTQQEIAERKQVEDKVRRLNAELEERVAERTAQLEAANKELEAFSYSVSHDLRAPLRGIDGWSLALLEDYGDRLDEQARVYLGRVRSEAQRMGQLIDDLLQLSRVARADMRRGPVDLTALARAIAARLQEAQPERRMEFILQPGLTAAGVTAWALTWPTHRDCSERFNACTERLNFPARASAWPPSSASFTVTADGCGPRRKRTRAQHSILRSRHLLCHLDPAYNHLALDSFDFRDATKESGIRLFVTCHVERE